jgi:hypothetical protein
MPVKEIKIGFDSDSHERFNDLQEDLNGYLSELKQLANQSIGIGKLDNVKSLLENPAKYLVETYRELYLSTRPLHLDFNMIFENETSVKIAQLDRLQKEFAKVLSKMGNHAPTINAKGMTSNVKSESFDIYLNPAKEDHFKALQGLLEAVKVVSQYEQIHVPFNLVRSIGSLYMANTGLEIAIYNFKK